MSIGGPKIQGSFSIAHDIGDSSVDGAPISSVFRGITDQNYKAHIEIDHVWYSFEIDALKGNDEGHFHVEASSSIGPKQINLSVSAVAYIQARRDAVGYEEKMAELGFPEGHYGHRPYE